MVSTRSGRDHVLIHAIALSKVTVKAAKKISKTLLGPKSRARKIQAVPGLSGVSQSSRNGPKTPSGTKPKIKERSILREAKPIPTRTLRTRVIQNAAALVTGQGISGSDKKMRLVAEYIERETDAAKTVSIRIRTAGYTGPAFKPERVNLKNQYPRGFFSNNKGFKVGHHPFLNWKGPSRNQYWDFFHALKEQYDTGKKDGLKLDLTIKPLLPGHAYTGDGHRFHALVEPILSCATSNNNQKLGSDNLKHNLTYRSSQITKTGSPNYHKLRTISQPDFAVILRPAGRQKQNSIFIMALYNTIRAENIKKRGLTAEEADKIQEDAENAEDWTDGLLSLDFMVGMGMQEMFDKLVSYAGMACKTAACVMCFSFHFAVFAVDTHIFRLCQWAGWLPRNCNRDDAFKFFTVAIPPELHRDLHQALWHHAQLCFRCNAKTYHKVNDPRWKATACPLEQLGLVRFPEWEKKAKAKGSGTPNKKVLERTTTLANELTTVPLNTEKDLADANASGHTVRQTDIDDAFGARPDLSNTQIKVKRFLSITRAEASTFRKFQKSRAEAMNPKLEELITVPLRTEKDVEDAYAAEHQVMATVIGDSASAPPARRKFPTKLKGSLHITRAQAKAFKTFQKSRAIAVETETVQTEKTTITEDMETTTTTTMIVKSTEEQEEVEEDDDTNEEFEDDEDFEEDD